MLVRWVGAGVAGCTCCSLVALHSAQGSLLARSLTRHVEENKALPTCGGPSTRRPEYLHPDVELVVGDVRDPESVRRALDRVDAVFHFAARVGVGQSMYEIADYTSVNEQGTAQLLEALAQHPIERLIVASSMSIYGEGLYQDLGGRLVAGSDRPLAQLRSHTWELHTAEGDRRSRLRMAWPDWRTGSRARSLWIDWKKPASNWTQGD
jgi:dTDP-L-rhamnose 4-epimerase